MPLYEFRCPSGHDFEKFYRSIGTSSSEEPCPECGVVAARVMSTAGLVFKGSGFYITDYGKDGKKDERDAAATAKTAADTKTKAAEEKKTAATAAEAKPSSGEVTQAAASKPADAPASRAADSTPKATGPANPAPKPATPSKKAE